MLIIDRELEMKLNALAEQEHTSPDEIVKQLIRNYIQQKQESELLINIVNNLPEVACFNHQDPLEMQRVLRNEWR